MCAECKKNGAHRYSRATYKGYGDFSKMPLQVVTVGSSMLITYYSLYSWLFCVNIFLTLVSCRVCFSPDCRYVYIYILYLYIFTRDNIWTDLYLNITLRQNAFKYISIHMHYVYILYTSVCIDSILVSVSPDLTAFIIIIIDVLYIIYYVERVLCACNIFCSYTHIA